MPVACRSRANVKGGEQKAVKFSWMPRLNRGMTERCYVIPRLDRGIQGNQSAELKRSLYPG